MLYMGSMHQPWGDGLRLKAAQKQARCSHPAAACIDPAVLPGLTTSLSVYQKCEPAHWGGHSFDWYRQI